MASENSKSSKKDSKLEGIVFDRWVSEAADTAAAAVAELTQMQHRAFEQAMSNLQVFGQIGADYLRAVEERWTKIVVDTTRVAVENAKRAA